jgi:hypothetical protein
MIFVVTRIGWECDRLQHPLLKKVVYGVKNKRYRLFVGVFRTLDSKRFSKRHCITLDRTLRYVNYSFTKFENNLRRDARRQVVALNNVTSNSLFVHFND